MISYIIFRYKDNWKIISIIDLTDNEKIESLHDNTKDLIISNIRNKGYITNNDLLEIIDFRYIEDLLKIEIHDDVNSLIEYVEFETMKKYIKDKMNNDNTFMIDVTIRDLKKITIDVINLDNKDLGISEKI